MTASPVGVGFVGAGSVLWAYLQMLDRLGPRGLAREGPICARRREVWPDVLERRPAAHLVEDPREVLESDVDVVVILTPPSSHAELALRALEHGKHVLVEKPLARNRSDGDRIAALAANRGLHVVAAPFTHLSATFRLLARVVRDGEIGHVHSARGHYGNPGSTWAAWYHEEGAGPLEDVGIYNLKSLTALLGPVVEVVAAEATAVRPRRIEDTVLDDPAPDVVHVILRHDGGALSSVVASHAIQRYRRPALELYGTAGTANLLGDDWDPSGLELWRNELGRWEEHEPPDATWLWTDGLRELIVAIREGQVPQTDLEHDLHVIDVLSSARRSAREQRPVGVHSSFRLPDLATERVGVAHGVHDRTRPADEQL